MDSSIQMVRLQHPSEPLFSEFWLPVYRTAFPDNERIPEEEIERSLEERDKYILVGCISNQTPICMAYCIVSAVGDLPPYLYLVYLATLETERSKGWGGQFFEQIVALENQSNPPPAALILEVQDVIEAAKISEEEKRDAILRLRFYEKHGCLLLKGSHYIQKVEGFEGVLMQLLCRPLRSFITPEMGFSIAQSAISKEDITRIGSLSWSKPTELLDSNNK